MTGAGNGIGAACCRALADAGFRVAVHYRSSAAAAEELAAKLPDAFAVRADLALPAEIDALVAELKERAGRVDVLVNNAGLNRNGLTPAMKLEQYDEVAAMARGTWYLTKLVLRRFMLRQDAARIINITSVVGQHRQPGPGALHHGEGRPRRLHEVAGPGARRAGRSS